MADIKGAQGRGGEAGANGDRQLQSARRPLLSDPLCSLDALKDASLHSPPIRYSGPDSGKIVLSKLTKDGPASTPAVLDAMPALAAPMSEPGEKSLAEPEKKLRNTTGLGVGVAVAGIAIAGAIIYALRTPPPAQATTPAAGPTATAQAVESSPTSTVTVAASAQSAQPTEARSEPKPEAPKSGAARKKQSASRDDNPYSGEQDPEPAPPPTSTQTAPPAPKPSPCGCAAQDLKCNMDCAVSGKK